MIDFTKPIRGNASHCPVSIMHRDQHQIRRKYRYADVRFTWRIDEFEGCFENYDEQTTQQETKMLDCNKPYAFRGPTNAIVKIIYHDDERLVVLITKSDGSVISRVRGLDGKRYRDERESVFDIVNVEPVQMQWLNIYSSSAVSYGTKEQADKYRGSGALACIRVEFRKGDGL